MNIKYILLNVVIAIIGTWVVSCSDHYAADKVTAEAADISAKLDSAALPVHPNRFADMSFLSETAEHNLTIHYRYQRQDYGISISESGAIDTVCPKIYGFPGTPNHIVIQGAKIYQRIGALYGPVMVFPEFQVPFNTVHMAYASSKGKSPGDFKFYIEMHLTDGVGGPGPYIHSHFRGFDKCEYSGKSDTYFYTLAADTLEMVRRIEWNRDQRATLQRFDYSVAEPVNLSEADGVFASETEMREYLLDEYERTFGERCGDILISDLRAAWIQYLEMLLERAGTTAAEE